MTGQVSSASLDILSDALEQVSDRAKAQCEPFDELRMERRRELDRQEARRRGGHARHARNDCARARAARLIWVMAPAGGWTKPAHAAGVIEARLVTFITARRLSIVCESNLRRTIVRWIFKHPRVSAAYLATCAAQT